MMLKLVDTSQKIIILGIFILDKVTCLRALLDPPPPQDGVSEFTGRYPLPFRRTVLQSKKDFHEITLSNTQIRERQ